MDPCLRSEKQIVNFHQKTDYENSESQISYSNQPVVAQPMGNQMMPVNPPMSNMGHQIFQTPYGQTVMVPSNATMSNPSQGQIYAQSTPSAQPGSYLVQPSNAVPTNPYSFQSASLHSNINQMPSQSAAANPDDGQAIAPTTTLAKSGVNQTPKAVTQQLPAVTSNYQKALPPINKPQSELSEAGLSQTDGGDNNTINDPSKLESQQNVEN